MILTHHYQSVSFEFPYPDPESRVFRPVCSVRSVMMAPSAPAADAISALPPEILLRIFSHFEEAELAGLGLVSRTFYCLTRDRRLWRELRLTVNLDRFGPGLDGCAFNRVIARTEALESLKITIVKHHGSDGTPLPLPPRPGGPKLGYRYNYFGTPPFMKGRYCGLSRFIWTNNILPHLSKPELAVLGRASIGFRHLARFVLILREQLGPLESLLRELPDMMSAKFSAFLHPSPPLSALGSDLCYTIHATSLTTSASP